MARKLEAMAGPSMLSVHKTPLTFSKVPFFGIHSSIILYLTFDFDPMQVLSLYSYSKKNLWYYLSYENRKKAASRLNCEVSRIYKQIRTYVFHSFNEFLLFIATGSPGMEMNFNFSQRQDGHWILGMFTESKLAAVLQTKYFEAIDKISPMFCALVDFYCEQSNCAD